MSLKLKLVLLSITVASTFTTNAQCNCQTFNKNGKIIKQCPPSMMAGDNSMQIGIGLGKIAHQTEYASFFIRFRYTAEKVKGNLSLVLANGKIISLKMLNSGISYIGNSEVSQSTFLLTNSTKELLKKSPVRFIGFHLEDGMRHQLRTITNDDVFITQLNCL